MNNTEIDNTETLEKMNELSDMIDRAKPILLKTLRWQINEGGISTYLMQRHGLCSRAIRKIKNGEAETFNFETLLYYNNVLSKCNRKPSD